MIRLPTTAHKLQAVLAGAITTNQLHVVASFADKTTSDYAGGTKLSLTNGVSAVDIVDAPIASTIRDIDYVGVYNADTVAATVTIQEFDGVNTRTLATATLNPGDQLIYVHGSGWQALNNEGQLKGFGEKGDQGVQGIQGVQGDQGIQGVQGDQGIQGVQGDQGIQGIAGPPTVIQDEGSPVGGAPHTTLNFVGAGVTASDAGAGVATVTIPGGGAASDQAAVQARRTTTQAIGTAFADLTFDATDFENDAAVVEHDAITDRIVLKEAGPYEIYYRIDLDVANQTSFQADVLGRVRVNDTTVLPGSESQIAVLDDSSLLGNEVIYGPIGAKFIYNATANDFITVQVDRNDNEGTASINTRAGSAVFTATRMSGATGAAGAAGPSGGPVDVAQATRSTTYTTTLAFADVTLDVTDVETNVAVIDHVAGTPDNFLIGATGTYRIDYNIDINTPGSAPETFEVQARVRVNDTTVLVPSESRTTVFTDSSIDGSDFTAHLHMSFVRNFTAADFVTLQLAAVDVGGGGTPPATRANGVTVTVTRMK